MSLQHRSGSCGSGGGDVTQVLGAFASLHCPFVVQVMVMVAAAGLSFTASVFISAYSCLTFTYGEEDEDVFHHHSSAKVVSILNTRTQHTPDPDPSLVLNFVAQSSSFC